MEADVIITGHVGTPVDYRSGAEGWRFADFRLACTPRRRTREGEWVDEETTWITVSTARALADHIRTSLRTGDPVIVVGKLRTQRYRTSEGVERERLVLEASTIGHDLTRGTSGFTKAQRSEGPRAQTPDDPADTEPVDDGGEPVNVGEPVNDSVTVAGPAGFMAVSG